MPAIPDHDPKVEALARDLLRETIKRQGWYAYQRPMNLDRLIERDVELMWPVMTQAAREQLREAPSEILRSQP